MIDIVIENTSKKPIYQQIFDQVSAQIVTGGMRSGDKLPPIRTVAKELRISVIPVKKAWETLEREGLIYTSVGRGCFVADMTALGRARKQQSLAREKMAIDIAYYKELGLSLQDIIDTVKSLYNE